jgi:hypothetical protein
VRVNFDCTALALLSRARVLALSFGAKYQVVGGEQRNEFE